MNGSNRSRIRIAWQLRDQLVARSSRHLEQLRQQLRQISEHLTRLQALEHKLSLCQRFNLLLAAQRLREHAEIASTDLGYQLRGLDQLLRPPLRPTPSLRDLAEDLRQLQREFGSFEFDADDDVLSVETDPITLEDVELGAFQIRLYLRHVGQRSLSGLQIVALDPHPAVSNSAVTHPHVSDEGLCPGDAMVPLEAALEEARLTDVFMLVRAVLEHYNASSPYIALSNWCGPACSECGYTAGENESYICSECDSDLCSECVCSCNSCDGSFCGNCLRTCEFCDEHCCRHCMRACAECGRESCDSCFVDDRCPSCYEKKENPHEQETEETTGEVLAPTPSARVS